MALEPLHEERQLVAIKIELATAPKIQDDLKEKFGYGENKFFDLDLIEYRINNSCLEIAEDLDVKSLYGLTSDNVTRDSVGFAFRGHHDEDFMPDYRFDGLLGKELNDTIEEIRYNINGRKGGRKLYERGEGIFKLTSKEHSENSQKGIRKANETMGHFSWTEEDGSIKPELDTLEEKVEESIGKGYHNTRPSWDYVHTEFNKETGLDLSKRALEQAHRTYNLNQTHEEE